MIEIVPYKAEFADTFKSLNESWIEEVFGTVGEADQQLLNNPEEEIIEKGGCVLIALMDSEPVGTCSLIPKGEQTFELAKMAVDEKARGNGIGDKLGLSIIEEARKLEAKRLYLETHSSLGPAIELYKKLGFKEACNENANSLCNRQMEFPL